MDAVQLRFMALVLKMLMAIYGRQNSGGANTYEREMHDANDMVIFLEARARTIE